MQIDFNILCIIAVQGILINLQVIQALVTNEDIPETDLQTGVWYTIKLKHNDGIFTWSATTVKSKSSGRDFNYAQIVYGEVAKDEYYKDQKYYDDTQWMLIKSEVNGSYLIRNKKRPDGVLIWVEAANTNANFRWAVLFLGHAPESDKNYAKGGALRKDALWKFSRNTDGTYGIYNTKFPNNGILTYHETENTNHKEKKYCQVLIGDSGANFYYENPKFQWSFEPEPPPDVTDPNKYVPVKQIPGTNLWTGTYYTISSQSNEGKLTWTYGKITSKNSGIDYNQAILVFGDSARCEYEKTGDRYFEDTKWMLVPTEDKNGYLLRNLARRDAVLTWADNGKLDGFVYVVLYLDHAPDRDPDYAAGGKYRKDASFSFIKGFDETYQIYNLGTEAVSRNGAMTFDKRFVSLHRKHVTLAITTPPENQYLDNPNFSWIFRPARTIVQIKNIPGTTLFTGVSYTITLKGIKEPLKDKQARMVYSNQTFNDGGEIYNYLYAAYGEYRKKEFLSHSRNYEYAQWIILESTREGKYLLVNVAEEQSIIGWAGNSTRGHYMVSHEDHAEDPDYLPNGRYYDDVLWQFELNDSDGGIPFYNIYNSRFYPEGLVTWSGLTSAGVERRYLVIDVADSEKTKTNADYLWRFDNSKDQPSNRP